ncbi:MAG: hypothetical protein OXG16_02325 [Rhodospirillales bacterium]|nr:hypothetical protein [Rhodospirillales bacterium]MCY3701502.1 hypothetical protein [Rhodospirillales bacterium]
MAVTITGSELRAALRFGSSAEEVAEASRLLAYATEACTQHAPNAPNVAHNEAVVRLCGYLVDAPTAGRNMAFADALRNSGAASILAPYRTVRAASTGGVAATRSSGAGSPSISFTPQSAYAYRVQPTLTAPAVSTDQAISDTGAGYVHKLLDAWSAPAGITADNDFVTEWEGSIAIEVATACNLAVILRTTHKFGSPEKTLVHERTVFHDLVAGVRQTFPMTAYFSRSVVRTGTFRGVTVTAEDIAGTSEISYELELRTFQRKSEATRISNTLKAFTGDAIETTSYQLRQAVAGSTTTSSTGGVTEARVNQLIAAALANQPSGATLPPTATPEEATAGDSGGSLRSWTATLIRIAINAVVPAVFRTGNTDVIPASKLPAGGGAEAIHDLQDLTADLHLDGRANSVQITDASAIAFAVTGIPGDVTAIAAGDAPLDVGSIVFSGQLDDVTAAVLDENNLPIEAIIRLSRAQDRSEWELRVGGAVYPGSHWSPIQVTNGGYFDYFFTGYGAGDFRGWRSQHTTTYEGNLGEGADGIRAQLATVTDVVRDLHLDGATRLDENSDVAIGGVAAATILIADEIAIEEQEKSLNVGSVVFRAAQTGSFSFGEATATQTVRPLIRLKTTERVTDWRIRFVDSRGRTNDFVGGGWVPIDVTNGDAGFSYYISGAANAVRFSLWKSVQETTYHGALADGIVNVNDLNAALQARLVPGTSGSPAAGSVVTWTGSIADWGAPGVPADKAITVAKLADAVVARLLPTGGSNGQYLGRASGSPAWLAAPGGGSSLTLLGDATIAIGDDDTFYATGLTLPTNKDWLWVGAQSHTEVRGAGDGQVTTYFPPGVRVAVAIADLVALTDATTGGTPVDFSTTAASINCLVTEIVELQNFRDVLLGATSTREILVAIPSINTGASIEGKIRFWTE